MDRRQEAISESTLIFVHVSSLKPAVYPNVFSGIPFEAMHRWSGGSEHFSCLTKPRQGTGSLGSSDATIFAKNQSICDGNIFL